MFNYKSFDFKKLERIAQIIDRILVGKNKILEDNAPVGNKKTELMKELEDWNSERFILRHALRKRVKLT